MKKVLAAAGIGAAVTVGSLLGAGTANASDQMLRVPADLAAGDYMYTVTGSVLGFGAYELCQTPRCEIGDDLIDIDTISGPNGTTGYLTITPDVKYVKLTNLKLTPA